MNKINNFKIIKEYQGNFEKKLQEGTYYSNTQPFKIN